MKKLAAIKQTSEQQFLQERQFRRHHGTRQTKPVVPRPKQTVKPRSYGPPRRGSRGGRKPAKARPSRGCNHPYRDPVAQSFVIDTTGGVFVPSIDLFFSLNQLINLLTFK